MHAFLHCLSSYNYIVKSGAIDVNLLNHCFMISISRLCHLSKFCPNRAWSAIILAAQAPSAHSVHVLTTAFPSSQLLCFAFGLCINQGHGSLFQLVWELMAGRHRCTSHGGVTLSRDWLCQKWKALDILGTHLYK